MPRRIKVELAYKVNMGDYESYEIRYGIEDDARDGETIVEAHKRVEGVVSDLLWAELAEARKLSTNKSKGTNGK